MKDTIVILICLMLPILFTLYFIKKKNARILPFLVGMLAFVISQIFLRIPLLQALQSNLSYQFFMMKHPVILVLFLALTAGLFEESARAISFTCLKKKPLSIYDALVFGLGHGGIEAILLVGLPLLQSQATLLQVLPALLERIIAMLAHVMMSVIVWYGIVQHQHKYLMIAILVHMGLNCYPLIGNDVYFIEGYLLIYTLGLTFLVHRTMIKRWKNETM